MIALPMKLSREEFNFASTSLTIKYGRKDTKVKRVIDNNISSSESRQAQPEKEYKLLSNLKVFIATPFNNLIDANVDVILPTEGKHDATAKSILSNIWQV